MKRLYFPKGVHEYEINGEMVYAEYMGRQAGFECCVCGKGCNAFTFNILHGKTYDDAVNNYNRGDYETWGFGRNHIDEYVTIKTYIHKRRAAE